MGLHSAVGIHICQESLTVNPLIVSGLTFLQDYAVLITAYPCKVGIIHTVAAVLEAHAQKFQGIRCNARLLKQLPLGSFQRFLTAQCGASGTRLPEPGIDILLVTSLSK